MEIEKYNSQKKIKTLLFIGLIISACLLLLMISIRKFNYFIFSQKYFLTDNRQAGVVKNELLDVQFYDEKIFYDSLIWLKNNPKNFPDCQVAAAIVPHHLLAGFMPAGLFAKLASQKIETVFIVGPNHWEEGGKILTSDAIWKTPFGNVIPDEEIISNLKEKGLMQVGNDIMQKEHSTTGLFPLIKYYLPSVKIVPIILSAKNTRVEIEKLNDELSKYLENEKNVLVASVDFSHYLNSNEAESKDDETLKVLQGFDYDKLFQLNNDNLDSPASIATFLLLAQKNGKAKFEVIDHSNSANILGGNIVKTTSYFSLAACR